MKKVIYKLLYLIYNMIHQKVNFLKREGDERTCMNKTMVIALYDSDKEYIESFSEYLREQKHQSHSIILFTEITTLDAYCRVKKVDMIVIAEYLIMDDAIREGDIKKEDNIIILVDDKDVSSINGIPVVYRYQPVDLLISSILNICADRALYDSNLVEYTKKRRKCIVSVYSPIGRCGKTIFSIRLGVALSNKTFKVLLINLEEFSLFMKYVKGDEGENLSDLLYYYLSGNQSMTIKSEAVIRNYNGMDYIPPVKYVQDLRKISGDIWKKFIDLTAEVKDYDIIILDISNMVEDVFKMLEYSDVIVVPVIDEENCNYRVAELKEYIEYSDYNINIDKIHIINMSDEGTGEESYNIKSLMEKIENMVKG